MFLLVLLFFAMMPFVLCGLILLSWLLMYGRLRTWKMCKTVRRDLKGLSILIRMRIRCARAFKANKPIPYYFLQTVKKYPEKIAIHDMSLGHSFTFREVNEMACRYGHMLLVKTTKPLCHFPLQKGPVSPGDVVCLLMDNGVHYVAAWLGCAKIGAVSAWVNTNLRREPLAHTLKTSTAKVLICSIGNYEKMKELFDASLLDPLGWTIYVLGGQVEGTRSVDELCSSLPTFEPKDHLSTSFSDPLCYIYTSGTTGLPKAAVIKHFRFFYIASGGELAFGVRPRTDRLYISMPLYHTSAGVLGLGQTILHGATCVIRPKFSARQFWKDCVQHQCTVAQYIGELLRYLLLAPECSEEKDHPVRLLIGNGLRPAIWRRFQERFNVERIAEFYGSTEGTSNLVNIDGKEGSCGFMTVIPAFAPLYPIRLFRVDSDGELERDDRGHLIPIRPGEAGALACTIKKNSPLYHFEGYLDKEETSKKIIQNPLPGAEPIFLSGDILFWSKSGYFFFRDRMGDTFRWKGENVSTTEVEAVLCRVREVEDCAVYGVTVPGCEGRAGMAAITLVPGVKISSLLSSLHYQFHQSLAPYAIPLFIRILPEIQKTATFKMRKADLQRQGFHGEDVYFRDKEKGGYRPLTEETREAIEEERASL